MAELGEYHFSLFFTPSVREILLAIFLCVGVPIHIFINC